MSVFKKRPTAKTFSYDFVVDGQRFLGNTEAGSRKEAEAVEKRLKAKAKAKEEMETSRKLGEGPVLLRIAAGRYWDEVGKHHRDGKGTWNQLSLLVEFFGPNQRLDEIRDEDVVRLVAWRRAQAAKGRHEEIDGVVHDKVVSNATVNRTTVEPLRKLFIRARKFWGHQFAREPVWSQHRLAEPPERVRELHGDEEAALSSALREDYAPWFQFARATGLRLAETLITWDNVNWDKGVIETIGKRGLPVRTPITPSIAALLAPLKDHHPAAVFTYVCKRPKKGQVKGKRYPITYYGAKSEWQAQLKRSGVEGFRFHDVRHDMATGLLRKTGNLKLVMKALNHRDVKTTARYAHVVDSEVADALQSLAEAREKIPAIFPATPEPTDAK